MKNTIVHKYSYSPCLRLYRTPGLARGGRRASAQRVSARLLYLGNVFRRSGMALYGIPRIAG